jgi:hypothetical protein
MVLHQQEMLRVQSPKLQTLDQQQHSSSKEGRVGLQLHRLRLQ